MSNGLIKWFNSQKRFGFIQPDERSDDLFFHIRDVIHTDSLHDGDKVSFDYGTNTKGICAINVKVLHARTLIQCECCKKKFSVKAKCCPCCGDPNVGNKKIFKKNKSDHEETKKLSYNKKQIAKKLIDEGNQEPTQKEYYLGVEKCPCCFNYFFFCYQHFSENHVNPIKENCDYCHGAGYYLYPRVVTYGTSDDDCDVYPSLRKFTKRKCGVCNGVGKVVEWEIIGHKFISSKKSLILSHELVSSGDWKSIKNRVEYPAYSRNCCIHGEPAKYNKSILDKYKKNIDYMSSISNFERMFENGPLAQAGWRDEYGRDWSRDPNRINKLSELVRDVMGNDVNSKPEGIKNSYLKRFIPINYNHLLLKNVIVDNRLSPNF